MPGTMRKTMQYLGLADPQHEGHVEDYQDNLDTAHHATVTPLYPTGSHAVVTEDEQGWDEQIVRRIATVHPRTYNDATKIGQEFRDGIPVIMNLTDLDDADAKRLVDFASGLVFALNGALERVTNKVFLLSPEHVEIATDRTEGR